jgi:hypothetical protein
LFLPVMPSLSENPAPADQTSFEHFAAFFLPAVPRHASIRSTCIEVQLQRLDQRN